MSQSEQKSQSSFSERLYNKLILLYPPAYRHQFADPMQQLFADLYRDAQKVNTRIGMLKLWVRVLIDFATSVIEEQFSEVFKMRRRNLSRIVSIAIALGGILTIVLINSNWDESPYPFPSKDVLANKLFMYECLFQLYPTGKNIDIPECPYFDLSTGKLSEFTVEGIRIIPKNDWQSTPASFILPLLWFGGLVSLFIWSRAGKLGIAGLSAGIIGCLMMIASMFQASQSGQVETTWTLFSWGVFLLGTGLIIFGLGALKNITLPRWNALPLVMGLLIVALEAGNRWLPTDALQHWTQIQGSALLVFGIAWVVVGYILFANKSMEPKLA